MSGTGLGLLEIILIVLLSISCVFFMRRYRKNGNKNNVRICPHCRKSVESDAIFCEHCGCRISAESQLIKNGKKKILGIGASVFVLLIVGIFIFFYVHRWRWDAAGIWNKYDIGLYSLKESELLGLFRGRCYGYVYEDLSGGPRYIQIQVTDYYIATCTRDGRWNIYSGDYKSCLATGCIEVLPRIHEGSSNFISYAEHLAAMTGMVWVMHSNGYWGTINVFGGNTIDYQYDDIDPIFLFEKKEAKIICQKKGLWGMISISDSGNIVTEVIPCIFENSQKLKDVKLCGEKYIVTTNVPCYNVQKITSDGTIIKTEDYNCQDLSQIPFNVDFIHSGYAFFRDGNRCKCIDMRKLELCTSE